MKKLIILLFLMTLFLYSSTIPTSSQFLGVRERGIGVEVTSGGDIKILPKSTVGRAYIGTDYIVSSSKYDSLITYLSDGLLSIGTILITAAPEKFKTTTTSYYTIDGIQYSKSAEDNLVFSAAYTINTAAAAGTFYGAFLVQVNAAGTISTKATAADQAFATSVLAIASLPAPDTGNVSLGYIVVQSNDTSDWVANTDDMTDASDCLTATFHDTAIKVRPHTCP